MDKAQKPLKAVRVVPVVSILVADHPGELM
jgi:hypothetical protein